MKLPIRSHVGVGPIRFGMSREAVRSVVATPVRSFLKSPSSRVPTDAFDAAGIHVFYRQDGDCEAIELASPAEPTYEGQALLGRPYHEVRAWLRSLDDSLEEDDAGLTAFRLGFGVFAPAASSDAEKPVEAVIVFEAGYYETGTL